MTARSVLDGMKARVSALTWAPPWKAWDRGIGYEVHSQGDEPINSGHRETFTKADATFIAAAPTDVARLVAAVEAALDVAETLETYTRNARNNNHILDSVWESRASGYEAATKLLRAAIENALGGGE